MQLPSSIQSTTHEYNWSLYFALHKVFSDTRVPGSRVSISVNGSAFTDGGHPCASCQKTIALPQDAARWWTCRLRKWAAIDQTVDAQHLDPEKQEIYLLDLPSINYMWCSCKFSPCKEHNIIDVLEKNTSKWPWKWRTTQNMIFLPIIYMPVHTLLLCVFTEQSMHSVQ